jgi:hypothetical protein
LGSKPGWQFVNKIAQNVSQPIFFCQNECTKLLHNLYCHFKFGLYPGGVV